MLATLDLPQPVIMLLARWASEAIVKYVADARLSKLTEAYLARVQSASAAALGNLPDAPSAMAAAPTLGSESSCLADAATLALLEPQPGSTSCRFAVNELRKFVHIIIATRQPWERPKPGRTVCGWDYLAQSAKLFPCLPAEYTPCQKCAPSAAWDQFACAGVPSNSD